MVGTSLPGSSQVKPTTSVKSLDLLDLGNFTDVLGCHSKLLVRFLRCDPSLLPFARGNAKGQGYTEEKDTISCLKETYKKQAK